MRLIYADALLEALKDNDINDWFSKDFLFEVITNAPTVDREGWVSVDKDLLETDDGKWDATLMALWRRLQRTHSDIKFWNLSEIPEDEMYIFRAHFATALLASPLKDLKPSKPNVDEIVNRFLGWKLPSDFSPDCGIEFDANKYPNHKFEPIGTNLFNATQAKAMIEYLLQAAPADTE